MKETILQFGGGKFLRSFADFFVHEANKAGQEVGQVVVVQSTDSPRAQWLNVQHEQQAQRYRQEEPLLREQHQEPAQHDHWSC